jgi:glycosyltransferase involved in cell wall biosynthesis
MRINIVMGFFLPVPPESGGATEKTWHRLACDFAHRGHSVTMISRRWPRWANRETIEGVRHVRVPGFDHRRKLWQNLALDFLWGIRTHQVLPPADVTVVHSVALPVWLGVLRPAAGRVVVMPGRMPKGQYGFYRRVSRVIATSTTVRERVLAENPALAPVITVYGYPIAWGMLSQARSLKPPASPISLGFAGRIHPEKGVDLLIDAIIRLCSDASLPPWRATLCGPDAVSAGGGGPAYRSAIERRLRAAVPDDRWSIRSPLYAERALASYYGGIDIFCYPSLAARGETFGVSVAEAMAAGAAPVVSNLSCFRDFVRPGANGLTFDQDSPDAAELLASAIAQLLRDPAQRAALATAAREDVRRYDFPRYADALLADFEKLAAAPARTG